MTSQKAIVILASMGLAAVGGLLFLAMRGNVWAVGILFSGWSILCLVIGWSLAFAQMRAAAAKEQQSFMNNAKENIQIMAAMQAVQNRQNQTIMNQLATAARLPAPTAQPNPLDSLLIEDGIFDELEQG